MSLFPFAEESFAEQGMSTRRSQAVVGAAELEQILVLGEDSSPEPGTQCQSQSTRAGSELSQESGIVLQAQGSAERIQEEEVDQEDEDEGSYYHDLVSEDDEEEESRFGTVTEGLVNEGE